MKHRIGLILAFLLAQGTPCAAQESPCTWQGPCTWQEFDEIEARHLLASESSEDQTEALHKLLNIEPSLWLRDEKAVTRLLDIVAEAGRPDGLRAGILWLFNLAGALDMVEPVAFALASDETKPDLARDAAEVLANEDLWEPVSARLQNLFSNSGGVLRQEAAISIGRHYHPDISVDLQREVIEELVSTFKNPLTPPATRGDAIEAAERFVADRAMEQAILEMLEPGNWFFGARGAHWPVHGLVPTVDSLSYSKSSEATTRLQQLCDLLVQVPDAERDDVEWALNWALQHR